jgi:hypothetical protein
MENKSDPGSLSTSVQQNHSKCFWLKMISKYIVNSLKPSGNYMYVRTYLQL